ncbi:MAG: hypothetical protein AAB476_02330, partial [Patescibacteria group bacterium]
MLNNISKKLFWPVLLGVVLFLAGGQIADATIDVAIPSGGSGDTACSNGDYGSCIGVQNNLFPYLGFVGSCNVTHNNTNYTAKCNVPVNGACGLNATNYSASATSYPETFCNAGTASPASPAFPP